MTTEITEKPVNVQAQFEAKIIEKLRKELGECLPDDVLKQLYAKAMHVLFLEERKTVDGYGRVENRNPPWFVEEVGKLVESTLREKVSAFVAENHEVIMDKASAFLNTNALALMTTQVLTSELSSLIHEQLQKMRGY